MISMLGIIWHFLTVTTTIRKRRTRSSGRSYSSSRHRRQSYNISGYITSDTSSGKAVRQMLHRVRRPEERTPQIQPEQPIPQMQPGQRITPPGRMIRPAEIRIRPEMIRPATIPQAITVLRISTTCLALNKKNMKYKREAYTDRKRSVRASFYLSRRRLPISGEQQICLSGSAISD